jgi:sporulation integral membrane protein YlbJ
LKPFSSMLFAIIILILAIFMAINPRETVQAAASGFELWYQILVPALLPFFIVADLLVSLHFVGLIGALLEPIMRPVFRLPGCSALVIAMGYTSGFPMGAVLSRRLWEEKLITSQETERLVSFTNNSSPLFIIGAIGVGMLASPQFGYLLAVSHYAANLIVGFIWGRMSSPTTALTNITPVQALHRLWQQLGQEEKSIGNLLGKAISSSVNNLLAIGGFVVLFSVMTRMFTVWGMMDNIAHLLTWFLGSLNFSYPVCFGMGIGFFEITLGSRTIAATSDPVLIKLLAISIVIGFSGFSIIAQVMSIVAGLPVRLWFYLLSRLIQLTLSGLITWIGYVVVIEPMQIVPSLAIPAYRILYSFDAWYMSICSLIAGLIIIAILMLLSLAVQIPKSTRR